MVGRVGIAPTGFSTRVPDLQSGAFAAMLTCPFVLRTEKMSCSGQGQLSPDPHGSPTAQGLLLSFGELGITELPATSRKGSNRPQAQGL